MFLFLRQHGVDDAEALPLAKAGMTLAAAKQFVDARQVNGAAAGAKLRAGGARK